MIHIIFRAWLTFLRWIIKVIWKITCHTSFWSLIRKMFWALAIFRLRIVLFIKRTFTTCLCIFVKEIWHRARYAFFCRLKWCIWITYTLFTSNIVCWSFFTRLAIMSFWIPLWIYWTRCAILSIKKWISIRTRCTLFCINMKYLTLWTLFAC